MKLYKGYLFLFVVTTLNICYGMNEIIKEEYAKHARRNNIGGFQGCKNKTICGFRGFYLANSSEGLCDNCNFKEHPEQFVACLFCRKPMSKSSHDTQSLNCLGCRNDVKNVIAKKIATKNIWSDEDNIRLELDYYFEKIANKTVHRNFIANFKDYWTYINTFGENNQKPLFYKGVFKKANGTTVHIWISDFNIAEEDCIVITQENAEKHIAYICEKYNIFGPETGEQTFLELPTNSSFLYKEKI